MFLGASSPAAKSRPRLVDLNLIPPEYRRRPFPLLTTGLSLLALGSLVLLYAVFYAKTYSDLEVSRLTARVSQARTVVQSATGDPAALAQQEKLRAMRDDYRTLTERQIHWGDVFQIVGDVPPGVALKSASQSGFGVTITGSAINQAAASRYLDQLRNSGLFVNASIQMNPATGPVAFATPTLIPTQPAPPRASPPPAAIVKPPTRGPAPPAVSYPTPRPPPQATAVPTRPNATPTVTRTSTVTATPTPGYDFVVVSSQQLAASNPDVGTTDIRGKVLDKNGKPFPSVPLEIDSEGSPAWSATTTSGQDGTFDFSVSRGKFTVYPLSGKPQPAVDLYTGADGVAGAFNYEVVFKATFSGSVPPTVVGTATVTPTSTIVPTASPTPVSPGANLASLGCASAYMVQNGQVKSVPNGSSPNLAIDGNLGTEWNAGIAPGSGTQVIWQWSLPEPGQAPAGCSAAGLSDSQDQINGFQLVPDQNPAGTTTHELWLYSDPGCTLNVASTDTAYYTWQQYTSAGQVLPLRIEPPLPVRCVIIRTLADPSFVSWEEVQIFQELAPPNGFSTLTPTPTPRGPTPTVTATSTMTPSAPTQTVIAMTATAGVPLTQTAAATLSPSATPTATATFPPLWPHVGFDVASCGIATATSAGSYVTPAGAGLCTPVPGAPYSAAAAIDGDPSTYWIPVASPSATVRDPVKLTVRLCGPSSNGSIYQCAGTPTPPATNSVSDVQVVVYSNTLSNSENVTIVIGVPTPGQNTGYECDLTFPPTVGVGTPTATAGDGYPLDCHPPSPVPDVATVSITLNTDNQCECENGSFGVREIHIYEPNAVSSAARSANKTLGERDLGFSPTAGLERRVVASNAPAPVGSSGTPGPAAANRTPVIPTSGPVDFTIILEVASGRGYP